VHEASTATKCIDIILLVLAVVAWVLIRRKALGPQAS
jgi:hypothetical protein